MKTKVLSILVVALVATLIVSVPAYGMAEIPKGECKVTETKTVECKNTDKQKGCKTETIREVKCTPEPKAKGGNK